VQNGEIVIIGAGLAGSEAAWQAAKRGIRVKLYEMRPQKSTPAHKTGDFAELVCSNSLRAVSLENAAGLLKEEMRRLESLIVSCAEMTRVPAGGALAVDRHSFSRRVTEFLCGHPLIEVCREEIKEIPPDGIVVIATGPLTSPALAESIGRFTGEQYLYFYDAVAPIVAADSINMDKVFLSSRYEKGEAAYLNCPFNKEEYEVFWHALVTAERVPPRVFEREIHFEGCMPVEVLAARGKETLLYGPMKPVGLIDPRTGKRPYAVVQLRRENAQGTMYNLVGFQTSLKWDEQRRVFRLIPGLEEAEFIRYGVMHRNTYINSPLLLKPTFQCRRRPSLFFAGQITGVEGYIESAASGLVAGINAARVAAGKEAVVFPPETAHGALAHYITTADPKYFQPMNVNFGLFPPLEERLKDKRKRHEKMAQRALSLIEALRERL